MYEENNPPDISFEHVLTTVKRIFPQASSEDIQFLYHGSYNVYSYQNDYIFKFPDSYFRNDRGKKLVSNEVNKLLFLSQELSYKIPIPLDYSSDPANLFIHYKKIPGVSLSKVFFKMGKNEKINITKEIGKFLSELHSPKITELFRYIFQESKVDSMRDYINYWKNSIKKAE